MGARKTDGTRQGQDKAVSRRAFLGGTAAVGGAVALSGLAACSPDSETKETPAPSGASGGQAGPAEGWSWDTPPAPIADGDIAETIDADIAVVGAGISGCAAACRASQLGANVVVVEKMGFPSSRGGHYGAYQTNAMTRNDMTNDPMDQIASEWLRFEGNRAKQKIIYRYLERSSEVINWLEDYSKEFTEGGLVVTPITTHYVGPYYYEHIGTHTISGPGPMMPGMGYPENENNINAPVYFMWKQAEANGAQFLFNTPAEQLVQDSSGKVTGVIAKKEDGTYVKINAAKGVLLASGDFSGDEEMREAYCDPISLKCDSFSYTPPGANTGDGQKMAMWAGAHMFLGEHCSPSMMHLIRFAML
ncbi:MAG: FAD-dependent oxidoreductase, partial [Bifidobacteriaceae bacterium]|nr:FAD-dependent oxidoreductase [Bifidobacteriaceae bacterium]